MVADGRVVGTIPLKLVDDMISQLRDMKMGITPHPHVPEHLEIVYASFLSSLPLH